MIDPEHISRPNAIPALSAQGVTKWFGKTPANESVSLDLHSGSIHSLLGENGAGKSTLVSILFGLYEADEGRLFVNGRPVQIRRPGDALQLGIGLAPQHFSLIPALSALDNMILGRENRNGFFLDRRRAEREITALLDRYGLDFPLHERVGNLPVGARQRVEIAKILYRKARVMIFDEPTAALVTHEIDRFLETLDNLRKEGVAVLLITHRLPEVREVSDDITVLRKGRVVLQDRFKNVTEKQIAKAIIGEELQTETYDLPQAGAPFVRIDSLSTNAGKTKVSLNHISLDIHEKEILGIAGVAGNGQEELIGAIFGLIPASSGSIHMGDRDITLLRPAERRREGLALIPQDRREEGLLASHSVMENIMLNRHAFKEQRAWINKSAIQTQTMECIHQYQIAASSPDQSADQLSGGHQQRVVIARELLTQPQWTIAHNPTRGLDLRASRFVHEKLLDLCEGGAPVLLFSSELSELFVLCHRIAVMYRGAITAVRPTREWTPESLGKAMMGLA